MKKILHFENGELLAKMYQNIFERNNFKYKYYLRFPKNPLELVNLVLAENPDLILTDIIMMDMDGFKLTEILKDNKETRNIPIFALTNLEQKEDREHALALGMTDYFIKANFAPVELVANIRKHIN